MQKHNDEQRSPQRSEYPTNDRPFVSLTPRILDRAYVRHDGSFGGVIPRHSHRLKEEDIHPDHEFDEWLRGQRDQLRRLLELFYPELAHLALYVFQHSHGRRAELLRTKVLSKAKLWRMERDFALLLLVHCCILERVIARRRLQ